ncbi:MAG: sigma-70 family RNA polymerase sigma factor [Tissierellia bacterium]|nr:sigma-70 family RNA polymerase sigma factor [Tissierellia bacterium]
MYQLLTEAKNGKEEAIEELIGKFNPLIISSIRRYNNRIYLLDDLVQEGREEIIRAIGDYDMEKGVHFPAFLQSRLKYFYMNKERKDRNMEVQTEDIDTMAELIPFDSNIQEDFEKKLVIAHLMNEIDKLPPVERRIIYLYYFHNYRYDKIADLLGIKTQSVINGKHRAIKKLRKEILL